MATVSLPEGLELLDRRTRVVRLVLFAYIAISLVDIVVVFGEMSGAVELEAPELGLIAGLAGLVYGLFALALLTAIVATAMWIYRAHANLKAADIPDLQFTPAWAVGWYFIPVANLFKPFQAMRELWNQSLIQDGRYGREADPQLKLWWGSWITGNIASNIGLRLQSAGEPQAVTAGYALDIFSTAAMIVASWFLLKIIETVNAAQRSGTTMAHAFA